jgi:hypothetical protein
MYRKLREHIYIIDNKVLRTFCLKIRVNMRVKLFIFGNKVLESCLIMKTSEPNGSAVYLSMVSIY